MTAQKWTPQRLAGLLRTNTFRIAPYREDGTTPGTLIWVWAVAVDDAIYVRSSNPASRWYAAALREGAGIVSGDGWHGEVAMTHLEDEATRRRVDAEFARVYRDDPYLTEDLLARSRDRIIAIRPR